MLGDFEYHKATSVEECCGLLAEHGEEARVLAGGTDLFVAIRNREISPRLVVDIKSIEGLSELTVDERGGLFIGTAVDLNRIIENKTCRKAYPALVAAARSIATYQLRNRATLVGNLCNASPAADTAPTLLIGGAEVLINGPTGERKLPVSEFFAGVKRNALSSGEMVTGVWLPPPMPGIRTDFLKLQRIRGHDLAVINLAGSFDPEEGTLKIAIGSCAPTPILLEGFNELVQKRGEMESLAQKVNEIAQASIKPISDNRGSAEYRREMVSVYVRRLLAGLMNVDEGGDV